MIEHKIKEGMSITFEKEILERDTIGDFGSKALDYLLSTPSLVAILISASSKLLNSLVPEDSVTVGGSVELRHEQPTLLGEKVWMVVTVSQVNGNRISLDFVAKDKAGVIARGKHERFVVNGENVLNAAYKRLGVEQ
jgi:fluoroacetyl-CoA thioesterase